MSMPGFSAEASLERPVSDYKTASVSFRGTHDGRGSLVIPSFLSREYFGGHCAPGWIYVCGQRSCGFPGCCCRRLWVTHI